MWKTGLVLFCVITYTYADTTQYAGDLKCDASVNAADERKLVSNDAKAVGNPTGALTDFQVVSHDLTFKANSFIDADKKEDQACLTGRSWLSNRDTVASTGINPTLEMTMKKEEKVCGMIVGGRVDWPNDRAESFKAFVSGDGDNWAPVKQRVDGVEANDKEEMQGPSKSGKDCETVLFDKPHLGWHVRLVATGWPAGAAGAFRVGLLTSCSYAKACEPNPCKNEGVCTDDAGRAKCACKAPFSGPRCEKQDLCTPNPCKNGATCDIYGAEFECECVGGFKGPTCELPANVRTLGCTTQMRDGMFAMFKDWEPIPIVCPSGQKCKVTGKVFGNQLRYTDDSPICKCAIHTFGADVLTEGHLIHAWKVGKHEKFGRSFKHGILTIPYRTLPWAGFTFTEADLDENKKDLGLA